MTATTQTVQTKRISENPTAWWMRIKRVIAEWRYRARSRHELANLNDRQLRDIGLSRYSANFEWSKPFWRA
jgi:uncharacterized protein YjiS (DUF1127 family)